MGAARVGDKSGTLSLMTLDGVDCRVAEGDAFGEGVLRGSLSSMILRFVTEDVLLPSESSAEGGDFTGTLSLMILVLPTELPLELELAVLRTESVGDVTRALDEWRSATGPESDRADAFRFFRIGWLVSVDDEAKLSSEDEPSSSWLILWLIPLSESLFSLMISVASLSSSPSSAGGSKGRPDGSVKRDDACFRWCVGCRTPA